MRYLIQVHKSRTVATNASLVIVPSADMMQIGVVSRETSKGTRGVHSDDHRGSRLGANRAERSIGCRQAEMSRGTGLRSGTVPHIPPWDRSKHIDQPMRRRAAVS